MKITSSETVIYDEKAEKYTVEIFKRSTPISHKFLYSAIVIFGLCVIPIKVIALLIIGSILMMLIGFVFMPKSIWQDNELDKPKVKELDEGSYFDDL